VGKLTLSVDEKVVERAKQYASRRGTSISRLVEVYLDALSRPADLPNQALPPVTRRLRGILKGIKPRREDYVDYLERKYR
jgi:antitoxin component of RelBE/YafQ-DinJ toxin-antitoxin module